MTVRLLRRVTLSLAGRLPTEAENTAAAARGLDGLPPLLDALMKEEAFYDRLREGSDSRRELNSLKKLAWRKRLS